MPLNCFHCQKEINNKGRSDYVGVFRKRLKTILYLHLDCFRKAAGSKYIAALEAEAEKCRICEKKLSELEKFICYLCAEKVPFCPDCGIQMKLRVNRRDNTGFWGCKKFPICKQTKPLS